jgi:oligopeptidase B
VLFLASAAYSQTPVPPPPQAPQLPDTLILHGDTLVDEYSWLRKKDSPEVVKYLSAENEYARRVMQQSEWFQDKLYEEVKARLPEAEESLPTQLDSFYYYSRYAPEAQYPVYYRKQLTPDSLAGKAPEEKVLDLPQLAEQSGGFLMLLGLSPSPNQQSLAYTLNFTGDRRGTVFIKNLATQQLDTLKPTNIGNLTWANDSRTLFYTTMDTTFRANKVWRWQLGQPADSAQLVYEERDNRFQVGLGKSLSKEYISIISSASDSETSEVRLLSANQPYTLPQLIAPRRAGFLYRVEHLSDTFYVENNRRSRAGGLDYFTQLPAPEPAAWQTYLPATDSVQLEGLVYFTNFLAVLERRNFQEKIKILDKRTGQTHYLEFQEPVYSLGFGSNTNPNDSLLRFSYSSFTTPTTTYAYNLNTRQSKTLKAEKIRGGYNAADYTSERVWATAPDGERVPLSLVYKTDLQKNGQNPTLLLGYGAYGMSYSPGFSAARLSLLERGFVVAVAHVRGGGDGGFRWHDAGKMLNKQNTFSDFIAASERLIELGYTSPDKLVIDGGSAGGLLIGAVINQRPELYQAALLNVPFVDVINTMRDSSLPLTTFEYQEWGNPAVEEQYRYIRRYSPYENVKAQDYPHLLIQGGYNDTQVGYWEPAKLAARLRQLKTDDNLLLLRISMEGGHGLTAGRFNNLRQLALEWAFIFRVLGIEEDYGLVRGKVLDDNKQPLSYVTVYEPSSGQGATTNEEGEFVLELKRGDYQLQVRQVGFETAYLKLTPDNLNDYHRIQLKSEDEMLQQVEVTAESINPAYQIMRQAIDKRKEHLQEVDGFSAEVYVKNITRLDHLPEKWPKILGSDPPDSSNLGVLYLSESFSEYAFSWPDYIKEKMVSSKVAGQRSGFSWNRASQIQVNLYENRVNIADVAPRGVVSPLAENAMFFYRYDYEGYKTEGGKEISKIRVIPKRSSDPVFAGVVYIVEDEWSLAGADLWLTNKQVELFDSLRVQQDFVPVVNQQTGDTLRMPNAMQISAKITFLGFGASAENYTFYRNLQANPAFPKKYFTNEVFSIAEGANQRNNGYWQQNRPVLLTEEERLNYQEKDSLEIVQTSKPYLDSVDRKSNKFYLTSLILNGYDWRNSWRKQYFKSSNLLQLVQYNTVEGLNLNVNGRFRQMFDDSWRYWSVAGTLRYATAREQVYGSLQYENMFNTQNWARLSIEAGHNTVQFNPAEPISPLVNTVYTWRNRGNYMKLYQRSYGKLGYSQELVNGLRLSLGLDYENRQPLDNVRGFNEEGELEENFTSNNPLQPEVEGSDAFIPHQALTAEVGLRIRFRQRYETTPKAKLIYDSKYPTLNVSYRRGLPTLGADTDYDLLQVSAYDDLDFALLGKARWSARAGVFLSKNNLPFPDWQHFSGNQTLFLNRQGGSISTFHLLDYYALNRPEGILPISSNQRYLQAHYEHHFNGFLINKIPLLRRTKFQAVGGANYLYNPNLGNYYEAFVGIENILKVLRIDWATSFSEETRLQSGFRVGITTNL